MKKPLQKPGDIDLNIFELLGIFTAFYAIRFFMDTNYKKRKKKWVALDIILISILAFIVQRIINFLFN